MIVCEGNKYVEDVVQKFLEVGKVVLEVGVDENIIVIMRLFLMIRISFSDGIKKYIGSY